MDKRGYLGPLVGEDGAAAIDRLVDPLLRPSRRAQSAAVLQFLLGNHRVELGVCPIEQLLKFGHA
jgi:hypothetical protein